MFDNVRADYARYGKPGQGPLRNLKRFLQCFGFHALLVYRLGKWSESRVVLVPEQANTPSLRGRIRRAKVSAYLPRRRRSGA